MKILFRIALLGDGCLLQASAVQAQQASRFTISGYGRDGATGESLPGVVVVHPASGLGTTPTPTASTPSRCPPLPIRCGCWCRRWAKSGSGWCRRRRAASPTNSA